MYYWIVSLKQKKRKKHLHVMSVSSSKIDSKLQALVFKKSTSLFKRDTNLSAYAFWILVGNNFLEKGTALVHA